MSITKCSTFTLKTQGRTRPRRSKCHRGSGISVCSWSIGDGLSILPARMPQRVEALALERVTLVALEDRVDRDREEPQERERGQDDVDYQKNMPRRCDAVQIHIVKVA